VKREIEWPLVTLVAAVILIVIAEVHREPGWVYFLILVGWWAWWSGGLGIVKRDSDKGERHLTGC
jgi:hypothetical protein